MAFSRESRQTLKLLSSGPSFHSQPLPTLPFDLIPDILSRLQVKFLLQLRCVCKSWKSLISDPKFAKKHLSVSTIRRLHFVNYEEGSLREYVLKSYPLHSNLASTNTNFTRFEYFANNFDGDYPRDSIRYFIDSCNGILCIGDYFIHDRTGSDNLVRKSEVKVHTLGSNIWRNIQEFPFGVFPFGRSGKFVSGTINWLASRKFYPGCNHFIVSFDLAKESYQKLSPPSYGGANVGKMPTLGVLKDCLCLTCGDDVWVMKQYGKKESWTKLFTIPYERDPNRFYMYAKVIYVFEDDEVVMLHILGALGLNLILYNYKNGTLKSTNLKNNPEVCIESLIWPCS
ncbi:F-box/kelch-repeat protein At3g23880 [Medicago truncatula]|uniref:F-box/kelch-repeat protein At3g23880 n=1 Tax=Medicago truncatula TaxID=3880 RepID=UPI000D2F327B|nr:F-box/kelch-repeat protein At3g23880 [Medicago truncatula]